MVSKFNIECKCCRSQDVDISIDGGDLDGNEQKIRISCNHCDNSEWEW